MPDIDPLDFADQQPVSAAPASGDPLDFADQPSTVAAYQEPLLQRAANAVEGSRLNKIAQATGKGIAWAVQHHPVLATIENAMTPKMQEAEDAIINGGEGGTLNPLDTLGGVPLETKAPVPSEYQTAALGMIPGLAPTPSNVLTGALIGGVAKGVSGVAGKVFKRGVKAPVEVPVEEAAPTEPPPPPEPSPETAEYYVEGEGGSGEVTKSVPVPPPEPKQSRTEAATPLGYRGDPLAPEAIEGLRRMGLTPEDVMKMDNRPVRPAPDPLDLADTERHPAMTPEVKTSHQGMSQQEVFGKMQYERQEAGNTSKSMEQRLAHKKEAVRLQKVLNRFGKMEVADQGPPGVVAGEPDPVRLAEQARAQGEAAYEESKLGSEARPYTPAQIPMSMAHSDINTSHLSQADIDATNRTLQRPEHLDNPTFLKTLGRDYFTDTRQVMKDLGFEKLQNGLEKSRVAQMNKEKGFLSDPGGVEDILKQAGVKEGTPASRSLYEATERVAEGKGSIADAVKRVDQWYERMADYERLPKGLRRQEYIDRLRESMGVHNNWDVAEIARTMQEQGKAVPGHTLERTNESDAGYQKDAALAMRVRARLATQFRERSTTLNALKVATDQMRDWSGRPELNNQQRLNAAYAADFLQDYYQHELGIPRVSGKAVGKLMIGASSDALTALNKMRRLTASEKIGLSHSVILDDVANSLTALSEGQRVPWSLGEGAMAKYRGGLAAARFGMNFSAMGHHAAGALLRVGTVLGPKDFSIGVAKALQSGVEGPTAKAWEASPYKTLNEPRNSMDVGTLGKVGNAMLSPFAGIDGFKNSVAYFGAEAAGKRLGYAGPELEDYIRNQFNDAAPTTLPENVPTLTRSGAAKTALLGSQWGIRTPMFYGRGIADVAKAGMEQSLATSTAGKAAMRAMGAMALVKALEMAGAPIPDAVKKIVFPYYVGQDGKHHLGMAMGATAYAPIVEAGIDVGEGVRRGHPVQGVLTAASNLAPIPGLNIAQKYHRSGLKGVFGLD